MSPVLSRALSPARKAVAALALPVFLTAPAAHAVSDADLADHWAPVLYQDTDSSDYDADYLSAVDFDGDWDDAPAPFELTTHENDMEGLLATDPAYLVPVHFANRGEFGLTYTRNPYRQRTRLTAPTPTPTAGAGPRA